MSKTDIMSCGVDPVLARKKRVGDRLKELYARLLQPQLARMLREERRYLDAAASCNQAIHFIQDLEDLGKLRRVRIDPPVSYGPSIAKEALLHDAKCDDPSPIRLMVDISGIAGPCISPPDPAPALAMVREQSSTNLSAESTIDEGNHFYLTATIDNPNVILINIGCGIILPATLGEARDNIFPSMRAHYEREAAGWRNKAARVRMGVRWIGETYKRLQGCQDPTM